MNRLALSKVRKLPVVLTSEKDALGKSGVNKAASVHTLKHSYVTYLLERAVDLRVIQELLGHSSPVTTAIYTHLT